MIKNSMKRIKTFVLLSFLAFGASCGSLKTVTENISGDSDQKKKNLYNVPCDTKNARIEDELYNESAFIIDLPSENSILLGEEQVTKGELEERLKSLRLDHYSRKIIFIRANAEIDYGSIIEVLETARKSRIVKTALVVCSGNQTNKLLGIFDTRFTFAPETGSLTAKPDPLSLLVSVSKDGKITLNADPHNSLESLSHKLREIFRYREMNGVFIEGTSEVEKRATIKLPLTMKYAEAAQIIDAVVGSGSLPMILQIDDLSN